MPEHILQRKQSSSVRAKKFSIFSPTPKSGAITPPELHFISHAAAIDIKKGTLIEYQLKCAAFPSNGKITRIRLTICPA